MIEKPTQLNLGVFLREQWTFDNFIAESPAAKVARQGLLDISLGRSRDNLLLWGQRGSGLTHLLQATCQYAAEQGLSAQYLPLDEYRHFPAHRVLSDLAQLDVLCLDKLEHCAAQPEWEQALFHLFNELKAQSHVLVCAMHVSPSALAIALPDLRSRILSAATFQIPELSDEGKVDALITRAKNIALELPREVATFLLTRVSRNSEELFNILETLGQASLSQHRKLTIPFVKQELGLTVSGRP